MTPWINIDNFLTFTVLGTEKQYILKGIIYHNGNHFTIRIIDKNLMIWYYDGQTTFASCKKGTFLTQLENNDFLKTYNGNYRVIIVFYSEENNT